MMRWVTTVLAVAGLLSLTAAADVLGQKANPCGAKNPCAVKAKDAGAESATVKTDAARAPEARSARGERHGLGVIGGQRQESPDRLDSIQAP